MGQEILKKITKQEVIDFFNRVFINEKSTIEIHITPEMHLEEQVKYREVRKAGS